MKRLVVLGGGESGFGAAVLGKCRGWDVFLSDYGTIAPKYEEQLIAHKIEFEKGGHTLEKILNADVVVKSPGIADSVPIVAELRKRGTPVISEIEFAGQYNRAKTICITGANGKTTTAELTYHILQKAKLNVGLAGNIGSSFAYQVAMAEHDWYIVELSSFQLDGMEKFRADIALLTNITPDHLDRYENSMERYVKSKMRITNNLRAEDYFIYCRDDKETMQTLSSSRQSIEATKLSFGLERERCKRDCSWISDGAINTVVGERHFSFPISELMIKGQHNQYNAMAAVTIAMLLDVSDELIASGLRTFRSIEHRSEYVDNVRGVEFINDSKATNTDATWYAMEAIKRPTIWIVGGIDKGNDYTQLKALASERVKAVVCMGVDNKKLVDNFKDVVPQLYETNSMERAMEVATEVADEGDVVLLSPACASFDLFKNYEDRGELFKKWIKEFKAKTDS